MGDVWTIRRVEGGFIVDVDKQQDEPSELTSIMFTSTVTRVFTDSSSLLNYLHNEFAGSN